MRRALATLAVAGAAVLGLGAAPVRQAIYIPPACQTVTFHSEPTLDPQRACMNIGVRTKPTGHQTYLFATPAAAGAGIFRPNGSLVWWLPHPSSITIDDDLTVVRLWGKPYLAVWVGRPEYIGKTPGDRAFYVNFGTVQLYDQHYRHVGTVTAGPPFSADQVDMHEFRITPDGHALVGIYQPVKMRVGGQPVVVLQYVVQELSLVRGPSGIHTGRVVFQWDSLKHVPVSASYLPNPGHGRVWDYFHGNAITRDSDGNLLVSARNTWGVYKINVKTGGIMWQLGGKGDPRLHRGWCYQHDLSALGHDRYSVFDDGAIGHGCLPGNHSWHPSRGLIFRVNPSVHPVKVTLIHAYSHDPNIHSEYLGSTQSLGNGNVLVGWGTVPEVTQYSADGKVLMDLSLSQPSYRSFRFSWTGVPSDPPSVAGQLQGGGTDVWASWNGSTQVTAWQMLGGSAPTLLAKVGAPVHRTGFETKISLARPYPYVAVRALSASGQVLGTSSTVSTTG
jgi:hypothetical protein